MSQNNESEAEIHTFIDGNVKAVRSRDVDGAIVGYARDVVLFDVVGGLQFVGVQAMKQRLNTWFSSFHGPIGYEVKNVRIVASEDVAYCHSLNHVNAPTRTGATLDMWWRATLCFTKVGGRWLVTHSHTSVPFEAESGKASLNLKP